MWGHMVSWLRENFEMNKVRNATIGGFLMLHFMVVFLFC